MLNKEDVKAIALECGFKLKEGDNLRPYVYQFADAIANKVLAVYNMEQRGEYNE